MIVAVSPTCDCHQTYTLYFHTHLMSSLKKNFFYSSILTTANYIFPLLTYPYVSRVLGVNNIGVCNFIDGIINYFVLFSMMGISILGIREVATNKNNPEKLQKTFSSLLTINSITTIIELVILAIATVSIPRLAENIELMIFGGFKLLFNLFLIEWFYKGLEDFRYITVRTILVKCLYVIAVFAFVRESTDYPIYYLITILMVVVNAIVNIIHSRKFTFFSFKDIKIKPYVKPYFTLGIYMLLTSMYTSFNVIYLGIVGGDTEVGYYTTATKLYTILIALFTALTGVLLPRMSSLIAEGKIDEFKAKINRSVNILLSISLPAIIFMTMLAPQIIFLISGPGYEGAIVPMRIIMPLFFIIGYEQILVIQTMMPLKMDKIILKNSMIGAFVGVSLNILLVTKFAAVGSAIVWVASELTISIFAQIYVSKQIGLKFPITELFKNIGLYIPLAFCLYLSIELIDNRYYLLFATTLFTALYFIIVGLFILKNQILKNLIFRR